VSLYSALAVVLAAWGLITLVRRIAESEQRRVDSSLTGRRADVAGGLRSDAAALRSEDVAGSGRPSERGDGIDYEELERAEDEIRDLGADARPEDGFAGDEWGPGVPKKPQW